MKLQLLSDLHTEFEKQPLESLQNLKIEAGLDFIVLVGDIVVPNRQVLGNVQAIFNYLAGKAKHIIYVTGNHEYYGGSLDAVDFKLENGGLPANLHWLRNTKETIEGLHFFGGTMWFPYNPMNVFYHSHMSDFSQIEGLVERVYTENTMFTKNALQFVRPETIVVSHHLPHSLSTPPEFQTSQLNRFFVSDQTKVMLEKEPRLWFHGHTHRSCDYNIWSTRVVCHPKGYPKENPTYDPVILDV